MVNPSTGCDKTIIRLAPVVNAKVVQLTDFFSRKVVVGDAHVVFLALFNTLKPVNGHKRLKHMVFE